MPDTKAGDEPIASFFRFVPDARAPQRADRSAAGTMPARAFQYCEALRVASSFGWYVFPPLDFGLIWDGADIDWTYDGGENWLPLKAAQYPDFAAAFDAVAPDDVKSFSPPFLGALFEPGLVQIWSGFVARTAADWSLLVRPCANLPRSKSFEVYEGIIETDRWFGPLFINLRLTRTDVPIFFSTEIPLFQAQPIPRSVYADAISNAFEIVPGLEDLTPADWDDFRRTVVKPNSDPDRKRGKYAAETRKRHKGAEACPVAHQDEELLLVGATAPTPED
jgi:Family of unknown function (DUF6065)